MLEFFFVESALRVFLFESLIFHHFLIWELSAIPRNPRNGIWSIQSLNFKLLELIKLGSELETKQSLV